MGFYSNVVFPRIINLIMSDEETTKTRRELLCDVSGDVFELGFGTGLNLPHYPDSIKKLTTADPNPGMKKAAGHRIRNSPIQVDCRIASGEDLPFEDESFDTVVCTWTLCSIRDVERALGQCHRILRPNGKFIFVEHGLSDSPSIQKWQNRLNPVWKVIGDGCNLNRNIGQLLQDSRFQAPTIENYYMKGAPRFLGYFYRGVALKA